jgi:hypothetical protein
MSNIGKEGNYLKDGVLYNCLGRVVSPELCREYGWDIPAGQEAAYQAYLDRVFADYTAARAHRTPEQIAEEAYEMRAAFGPGVKVANVITGEECVT